MKICVFGTGSVGGLIALALSRAGHDIGLIARGSRLEDIRAHGLRLYDEAPETAVWPLASDRPSDFGQQDVVICTVKASSTGLAAALEPLVGPATLVVFAQNGIPWWYDMMVPNHSRPAPDLGFLDPGGELRRMLDARQIAGCVIHAAVQMIEAGVIRNPTSGQNRLVFGGPAPRNPQLSVLASYLDKAGLASQVAEDLRPEIWWKLAYNLCLNSICGVIGHPLRVLGQNSILLSLAQAMMQEGIDIARAHDVILDIDPSVAFTRRQTDSPHKPSLLQDIEQGRLLEFDALFGAAERFARDGQVHTPHLDTMSALVSQKAIDAGALTIGGSHIKENRQLS